MSEKQTRPDQPLAPGSVMGDILADALAIQDRFVAEPMLKTTGRGVLKSRGVEGLQRDAEELRKKFAHPERRINPPLRLQRDAEELRKKFGHANRAKSY